MIPHTNYLDRIVQRVDAVDEGYLVWLEEDSWGVFLRNTYGREPLAGDSVRIYLDVSRGVTGPCVKGLALNGSLLFYLG